MRSAGNFHPEWGYLAPAPSFLRTARVALVATAIGATAGAVVVVSLVARPGANDENNSIAAHALVSAAPIVSAPVVSASPANKASTGLAQASTGLAQASTGLAQASTGLAQAPAPRQATAISASAQPQSPAPPGSTSVPDSLARAGQPSLASAPPVAVPANVASVADTPAAIDASPTSPDSIVAPEGSPAKKEVLKKRRLTSAEAWRRWHAESNAKKQRPRDASAFGPLLRLFSFRGSSDYDN
jgi:hypothetical protein